VPVEAVITHPVLLFIGNVRQQPLQPPDTRQELEVAFRRWCGARSGRGSCRCCARRSSSPERRAMQLHRVAKTRGPGALAEAMQQAARRSAFPAQPPLALTGDSCVVRSRRANGRVLPPCVVRT